MELRSQIENHAFYFTSHELVLKRKWKAQTTKEFIGKKNGINSCQILSLLHLILKSKQMPGPVNRTLDHSNEQLIWGLNGLFVCLFFPFSIIHFKVYHKNHKKIEKGMRIRGRVQYSNSWNYLLCKFQKSTQIGLRKRRIHRFM